MKLTQERLKELLHYCPISGVFTWKVSRGTAKRGGIAGFLNPREYEKIKIDGKAYFAHRLAWLYVHGAVPSRCVDHVNGVHWANRILNLRMATSQQNARNRCVHKNSRSQLKGVRPSGKRWNARIWLDGRGVSLGQYDTPEEAHAAYVVAATAAHGDFFNPG